MNDKKLADRVYALLGRGTPTSHKCGHHSWHVYTWGLDATQYVRDWRVAGALMEKVDSIYPERLVDERWQVQASLDAMPTEWLTNESLPRAIIEACVEALT